MLEVQTAARLGRLPTCWAPAGRQVGEPAVVWLGGLHAPEAFIAALVQAACRARGWPLDLAALFTTARARGCCPAWDYCSVFTAVHCWLMCAGCGPPFPETLSRRKCLLLASVRPIALNELSHAAAIPSLVKKL